MKGNETQTDYHINKKKKEIESEWHSHLWAEQKKMYRRQHAVRQRLENLKKMARKNK